jgi:hypothetical protein
MPATLENLNIKLTVDITGLSVSNLQNLANSIQTAIANLRTTYPTTIIQANMQVDVPVNVN